MSTPALTIELNADAAIAAMAQGPARVARGTVRSLNRAGTTGRAEMARRIAKDMSMKVGDAKDAVLIDPATLQTLTVRLRASRKLRPVSAFSAKQTAKGVTYRGRDGQRTLIPGAFMARMPTGHEGVFMRRGKKRLPIRELFAVSVGHVFNRHRADVVAVIQEAFEKNLAHELEWAATETSATGETGG